MNIEPAVVEFIKKHEDLLNNSKFEELFKEVNKKWHGFSSEMDQLYNIIKAVNIDPNLEKHIPSILRVYNQIIGAGATFIGWNYAYETEDEIEWYKQHEGNHGKIIGLNIAADYDVGRGSPYDDDVDNFIDSYWDFKFDNGDIIDLVSDNYKKEVGSKC